MTKLSVGAIGANDKVVRWCHWRQRLHHPIGTNDWCQSEGTNDRHANDANHWQQPLAPMAPTEERTILSLAPMVVIGAIQMATFAPSFMPMTANAPMAPLPFVPLVATDLIGANVIVRHYRQ